MNDWKYNHLLDLLGHIYSGRGGMPEIVELQKWLDERKEAARHRVQADGACTCRPDKSVPEFRCKNCGGLVGTPHR